METEYEHEWKGMDGAIAFHLIDRYAETWADTGILMEEWLDENRGSKDIARYAKLINYLISDKTYLDDDFVACTSKDEFDCILDKLGM